MVRGFACCSEWIYTWAMVRSGKNPLLFLLPFLVLSCASAPAIRPVPDGTGGGAAMSGIPWQARAEVTTRYGTVLGKRDSHDTFAWLGIPYAAPPVGPLRWKPPLPPAPWKGLRDAGEFGAMPVQRIPIIDYIVGSEDCLFLNIWRPAGTEAKLPVHIWIHGGDNAIGSADINPDFHGQAFAARAGAVFVSVNFRLGIFGWLRHPSLFTGDPETDSGDFGTLDIIAALEWVRDNIAAFGGDPGNVTITGESSGAINVLTLLLAPKARGLFHKAVAESPYLPPTTPGEAEAFAGTLIERQRAAKTPKEASALAAALPAADLGGRLREADARELIALLDPPRVGIRTFPFPIFDGRVLPSEGFSALSDPGRTAAVPLIIGTTKEEAKVFQWFDGLNLRDPLYLARAELESARWRSEHCEAVADALVSASPDRQVYVYRFDWGAPDEKGESVLGGSAGLRLGASHGLDMSFFLQSSTVYGNIFPFPLFTRKNEKGRNELKSKMVVYLSDFMRTGDPNGEKAARTDGVPVWEAWKGGEASPSFIVFDAGLDEARIRLERGRVNFEELWWNWLAKYPELKGSGYFAATGGR